MNPRVFVATQTFNRPRVAEACLKQQASVLGPEAVLYVWDDHSTNPPNWPDLLREPEHLGPHKLRIAQLRAFLCSDCEEIYLSDSDAVLDPNWLDVCRKLESESTPIVSLFNSSLHKQFTIGVGYTAGVAYAVRKYAPGISYYMRRETVEEVITKIDLISSNWDFALPTLLGNRCAIPLDSYCDHYGAGGIHTPVGDWTRDMAVSPTHYLADLRYTLLPTLQ